MLNSKQPETFLHPLKTHIEHISCIDIPGEENAQKPEALLTAAQNIGIPATQNHSAEQAVREIIALSPTPGRILICGSLYLAGTVLANHQ
jgi:dihydrofolate synthase/folylpolyglutamate synthase